MHKYRIPILPSKSPSSSFTLVELIIVIIIVGILAAMGISQYSKTVEKGRGSEARMILGQMRKLAYNYWLENGTISGMTTVDINISTNPTDIPSTCRDTHYFYYGISGFTSNPTFVGYARRCSAGGKTPQKVYSDADILYLVSNFATGTDYWIGYGLRDPSPY